MSLKNKGIKIFAGNANKEIAEKIVNILGMSLGEMEVSSFSDGETSVSIRETVRGYDVFLIQPTCPPVNNNLMELLVMIDACKRASARQITAVIPYFGYARQDRKAKPRDPISAKLIANIITAAGVDRVITMDLHVLQIQGFFDIPIEHILGLPVFLEYFEKKFKNKKENLVIVSPDVGSVARVRKFAKHMEIPLAIIDKRRQTTNMCEIMNIVGSVENKDAIIMDDMIDTAGTICKSSNALINIGKANKVFVCATHGVLSNQATKLISESKISELVLLDTIPVPKEKMIPKIKVLSTAPLFAEVIRRVYENKPVSQLFN